MPLDKIKTELESIRSRIFSSMLEVYDRYTVDEWTDTYLSPFEKDVSILWYFNRRFICFCSFSGYVYVGSQAKNIREGALAQKTIKF